MPRVWGRRRHVPDHLTQTSAGHSAKYLSQHLLIDQRSSFIIGNRQFWREENQICPDRRQQRMMLCGGSQEEVKECADSRILFRIYLIERRRKKDSNIFNRTK